MQASTEHLSTYGYECEVGKGYMVSGCITVTVFLPENLAVKFG